MALINLSLTKFYTDHYQAAQEYGQQALNLAQQMGSKRLEGYALNTLGKVLVGMGQIEEAGDHCWQALSIWHELDQQNLAMEARAGLTRTGIAKGDLSLALTHATLILDFLKQGQSLEGTESPFSIYLDCYLALSSAEDIRARDLLLRATTLLNEQAASIHEEAARQSFLHKVTAHRELVSH